MIQIRHEPHFQLTKSYKMLQEKMKPWMHHPIASAHDAHRFRLKIKKLRYSLEMIRKEPRILALLQKHLGKVHDLHLLQSWIKSNKQLNTIKALEKNENLKSEKLQDSLI